jgi:hypothetical protein
MVFIGEGVGVKAGVGVEVPVGIDVAIPGVEVSDILFVVRVTCKVGVLFIGVDNIWELHDKTTMSANTPIIYMGIPVFFLLLFIFITLQSHQLIAF